MIQPCQIILRRGHRGSGLLAPPEALRGSAHRRDRTVMRSPRRSRLGSMIETISLGELFGVAEYHDDAVVLLLGHSRKAGRRIPWHVWEEPWEHGWRPRDWTELGAGTQATNQLRVDLRRIPRREDFAISRLLRCCHPRRNLGWSKLRAADPLCIRWMAASGRIGHGA